MAQTKIGKGEGLQVHGAIAVLDTSGNEVIVIDADGNVDAPITTSDLTTTGTTTLGNSADATTVNGTLEVAYAGATTQTLITADDNTALTTGIIASVASSATAITGAGRLLRVDHTGATSTSGVLSEFASAASDETTIVRITASAALASGVALDLSTASVTTGTLIKVNGTAIASGIGIDLVTIPASQISINFIDGTASSINPSATAESGWINIGIGGVLKFIPYYAAS